jgi:hypothetical protein
MMKLAFAQHLPPIMATKKVISHWCASGLENKKKRVQTLLLPSEMLEKKKHLQSPRQRRRRQLPQLLRQNQPTQLRAQIQDAFGVVKLLPPLLLSLQWLPHMLLSKALSNPCTQALTWRSIGCATRPADLYVSAHEAQSRRTRSPALADALHSEGESSGVAGSGRLLTCSGAHGLGESSTSSFHGALELADVMGVQRTGRSRARNALLCHWCAFCNRWWSSLCQTRRRRQCTLTFRP